MAETVLAKMAIQIAANTSQLNQSLGKTQGILKNFQGQVAKIGGTIAGAFAVQQVASFAFEVSKLAGEAEGVKAAFDRLPDSIKLMNQLKEATGGTVSELELMKTTVQASNFGIGLQQLPELLKFAAIRAQQTGQSVEYLVQSIITGIGRKSPLILDNLGISAVRLKEKFGGAALEAQSIADVTKAVGSIATEELSKMGELSDNASSRVQQLDASWTNLKVTLGKTQFTKGLTGFTDDLVSLFNVVLGGQPRVKDLKIQLDASVKAFNELESGTIGSVAALTSAEQAASKLGIKLIKLKDNATGLTKLLVDDRTKIQVVDSTSAQQQITTLEGLQAKIKDLNDQFGETDTVDKKKLANIGSEIVKTQELIDQIEKLRKKQKETDYSKHLISGAKVLFDFSQSDIVKTIGEASKAFKEAAKQHEEDFKLIVKVDDIQLTKLPEKIKDIGNVLRESVAKATEGLKNVAKDAQKQLIDISGFVSNGITELADAFGTAIGTGNFKNFGKAILDAVAGFAQQLGALLIAQGIALDALEFGDANAKIAAGIALVAIGAAIKATLKNSPKVASSGSGSGGGNSYRPSNNVYQTNGNSKIQVEVVGYVRGQDIILAGNNYVKANQFTKTNG